MSQEKDIPIVVCTIGCRSLDVLRQSIKTYIPGTHLMVSEGELGNFGDDYNKAMAWAFEKYDEIIIANDDIVLRPDSYELLLEDVSKLKRIVRDKLGFVASRSDFVRPCQNIRYPATTTDQLIDTTYESEATLKPADGISPIFAWVSKTAFQAAQFPPLNWFSDDVMCQDLNDLGFKHFVSRSYVHHAGSQTIGRDARKLIEDALPWIKENRPQHIQRWFGGQDA